MDWEIYFMNLAEEIATRSTCLRKQVGCVITRENYIVSTGYNGALPGMPECLDIGCLRSELGIQHGRDKHLCRAVHAEQNAIAAAARLGTSLKDTTCYVTLFPCITCTKNLVQAGINKLVTKECDNDLSKKLLEESGVYITILD